MYSAPSLATLWRTARHALAVMRRAFGGPRAVMKNARVAHALRGWLAPLEALVRKLLLLEAQQIATWSADVSPARKRCVARRRDADGPPQHLTQPTPRLSFPSPRAATSRARTSNTPRPARSSQGMRYGLRFAALIDAIENPARYITRLARRLMRTPQLAPLIRFALAPSHAALDDPILEADLLLAAFADTS